MLLRFIALMFGTLFIHRILINCEDRKRFAEAPLMAITKIVIIIFWLLAGLAPWIPVLIFSSILILNITLILNRPWLSNFILRQQFKETIPFFIDDLILLMLTGRSFRDSFLALTSDSTKLAQKKLREVLTTTENNEIHLQKFKNTEFSELANLIHHINLSPHRALDKLKTFRQKLAWSKLFQKKSAQVTGLIRAQASVLTLLYGGLLTLTALHSDPFPWLLLTPSALLFISGLFLLFYFGKAPRWKT